MSMRLKVNKLKMYHLVAHYFAQLEYGKKMPILKNCQYGKPSYPRATWLDFDVSDYIVRTYIDICLGRPYLRIRVFDIELYTLCLMDKVLHPSLEELNCMGMLEEVV